jgi:hypothetical protein
VGNFYLPRPPFLRDYNERRPGISFSENLAPIFADGSKSFSAAEFLADEAALSYGSKIHAGCETCEFSTLPIFISERR